MESFFEDDVEYMEIFYDEENSKLGFKPSDEETEDGYTVTIANGAGTIAPTSFLKSHGLVPDVTTQYAPETEQLNEDTELVTIDLDDPLGTYGSPDKSEDE